MPKRQKSELPEDEKQEEKVEPLVVDELKNLKIDFAKQLNIALRAQDNGKGWETSKLAEMMGADPKNINLWRREDGQGHIPRSPIELKKLSETLGVSLDQLFGIEGLNQQTPKSRHNNLILDEDPKKAKIAYHDALSRATQNAGEIWFLFRSGITFQDWDERETIRQLMKDKPLKLRLLLCPAGYGSELDDLITNTPEEQEQKAFERQRHYWTHHFAGIRRDDWDPAPETVLTHVKSTIHMFELYASEAEEEARQAKKKWLGQLDIRTMPYLPSTVCHIANPRSSDRSGKAVVILFNFRKSFFVAPIWEINEADDNDKPLFDWLVADYNRHWEWKENAIIRAKGNSLHR